MIGLAVVGCGNSGEPAEPAAATPSAATVSGPPLFYLALGDSWPEGAHCGGCRTFAGLYADGLGEQAGRKVQFEDDTGQAQPFFESAGGGSASLLKALREDDDTRSDVAKADVIMIATGPNEIGKVIEPVKAGRCRGGACYRALGRLWERNFDAILGEIEKVRGGKPTAIRLVDAANPFVSVPEMSKGMPKGYATGGGARIFALLNDALCKTAKDHAGTVCVDVRPVLNGKSLEKTVDENSPEAMQAVADALLKTGLPAELKGGSG